MYKVVEIVTPEALTDLEEEMDFNSGVLKDF